MIDETATEHLLSCPPYGLPDGEKHPLLAAAMHEALGHHTRNCAPYGAFVRERGIDPEDPDLALQDYPFLPAAVFKHTTLRSVGDSEIRLVLESSATGGMPSRAAVDVVTQQRQVRALAAVVSDRLGKKRRPFVILDVDPRLSGTGAISARAAAVRGFMKFASKVTYCMTESADGQLSFDTRAMENAVREADEPIVVMGFTFVVYHFGVRALLERQHPLPCPEGSMVVHLGGWKKLEIQKVTPDKLLADIWDAWRVPNTGVVDFYGFTEQMGVNYPTCQAQFKHTPVFSEVFVRHPDTLMPVEDGREGLLQFITPLPFSYPGISVILDDVGRVLGRGRCDCGRYGTRFLVSGRTRRAEIRGCSDILASRLSSEGNSP